MENREYITNVLNEKAIALEKEATNQLSMATSPFIHHKDPYEKRYAELIAELKQCNDCIAIINQYF